MVWGWLGRLVRRATSVRWRAESAGAARTWCTRVAAHGSVGRWFSSGGRAWTAGSGPGMSRDRGLIELYPCENGDSVQVTAAVRLSKTASIDGDDVVEFRFNV
ncbi:hypothetical protein GCM10023080_092710 [Streptomyces pseudoechinosporeus]